MSCGALDPITSPRLSFTFCLQIKAYEKLECAEDRMKQARDIYDNFIMKELLARSHVSFFVCVCVLYSCGL